jgi:hypothetical protein
MHLSLHDEDALVVLKVEVIVHLRIIAHFALLVVAIAVRLLEAIFSFSSVFALVRLCFH